MSNYSSRMHKRNQTEKTTGTWIIAAFIVLAAAGGFFYFSIKQHKTNPETDVLETVIAKRAFYVQRAAVFPS